jgi:predicted DNA-binding transcriptional regulator AlpA
MRRSPTPCANPERFLTPKQGAYLAGISVVTLYAKLRSAHPPPMKRRGRKYILPIVEFTTWAEQDVIE